MGLNSKNSVIVVKEEAIEGCKDSGFFKGSPLQWPLSNTFDPSNKLQPGEIKKSMNENSQVGGTQFSMTPYSGGQQNLHSMLLPHEVKMVQRANQAAASSVNLTNPFFKTHFAGQPSKQPSILPSIAGTTEPWFNSKASRGPAQLTIFYGGTVNVFDAISPEKAQAIMFLAGNACNIGQTRGQVQAPSSKLPAAEDAVYLNQQPINTPPCSAISSPISVSSHPPPVGGGPTSNDGPPKTTGLDAPKIAATSMGHVIPSAVPQARKASLARFLEKRKERAMNAAPYNPSKNNGEGTTTPGGFNGVSFSGSSGVGSGPISTANC